MKQTFIYRLTHYKNLPFILEHGLHCANAPTKDAGYVNIGFKSLISHRNKWPVPIEPFGILHDFVPFFFCKKPVMLFLISKGEVQDYEGTQEEIIYLISSAEIVAEAGLKFVFTDRHALLQYAHFSSNLEELKELDWPKIESEKWGYMFDETKLTQEVKQAEFLVHQFVPSACIKAIVCATQTTYNFVEEMVEASGHQMKLHLDPKYYY